MALARVSSSSSPLFFPFPLVYSFLRPFSFSSSVSPLRPSRQRRLPIAAGLSQASPSPDAVREGEVMDAPRLSSRRPWKPTCLYYTQGKCTMMNDALHLEKFSHNLMMDLPVNALAADNVKPQKLDYFLILDLEGKVEILEFPVVMIDAQTMEFIDSFHRFVHPTAMSEQRITEYIEENMEILELAVCLLAAALLCLHPPQWPYEVIFEACCSWTEGETVYDTKSDIIVSGF